MWVCDLLFVVFTYLRVYSIRFTCKVSNKPPNKGSGLGSIITLDIGDPSTNPKSSQPSLAFEPRYLRTITCMSGLRLANWKRWFPDSSLIRFSKQLSWMALYLLMLSWFTTLLGKPPVRWKSSIKEKNIIKNTKNQRLIIPELYIRCCHSRDVFLIRQRRSLSVWICSLIVEESLVK